MDQRLDWITNFIWGIANIVRDVYGRGKYRDVILPMTVLRRLDAVLEPTKQAVLEMKAALDKEKITNQDDALRSAASQAFYNTSPFLLRDLKGRATQQKLRDDFEAYLDGFSPNVQEILKNFEFRNQIFKLSTADILGTLIEKFLDKDIHLSPYPTSTLPGLDNHAMGTIFEELLRRFNEENNEEAGEHWTPRDAVRLMANLVFRPIANKIESSTYLLYDGALGTGGMLTIAEEILHDIGTAHGKKVTTHLFGQEINAETYAICKADLLLKGEGDAADNVVGGPAFSTLSNDVFRAREFDFMLSNPPYGKTWGSDLERMGGKKGIKDPRFIVEHDGDAEFSLVTRSSDGQLLFLANLLSKMKHSTPLGSRIAEVHNGSSLFTGDAGQGESNIRRWVIENDWLEAIVALPLNMFYNTGIATYIWVLTNRKPEARRGKVQLIDATKWSRPLRKNMGKKNCELAPEHIQRICDTYLAFQETEESMPRSAAERVIVGFQADDPRLASFLDDFASVNQLLPYEGSLDKPDPTRFGFGNSLKMVETARPTSVDKPPITNTKEEGLESLLFNSMTSFGWIAGKNTDYDREYAVDLAQLAAFIEGTQETTAAALQLNSNESARLKFLARLQGEITKRGVIDVMRKGVDHEKFHIDLYYGIPTAENKKAVARHAANRFSITRQLHYSREAARRALDLALFINGLPVATFELKNSLTKQTVEDAVEQYRRDRDPRETLLLPGRCVVHFALDDQQVEMCTELKGKKGMANDSWFLPFNQGWNKGAGNPPNPYGIKTDYLWRRILTPGGLADILENYAQIVETKNEKTGRKKRAQIFPRYHQLDVVRKLLADAAWFGAGKRYLIQHSAGSGKSNSIAWLAHQLIGLRKDGADVFDSIIVITDRRVLDKQIRETIKGFAQIGSIIGAVKEGDATSKTKQLAGYLRQGKKIIISTVQTFPFVLDQVGGEHRGKKFAIIIDEAHSSQGGRTAAAMNIALSSAGAADEVETTEDKINRIIEARKLLPNASYFAFTATPKNKTLELFGIPYQIGHEIKHRPFHQYTMKQAIQEGFILDVLKNYTPVESYYRLVKTVEGDPEFDVKKARKKIRRYVESHEKAIRDKAEIMIDHFLEQVIGQNKIGGQARAMVVTGSIQQAIKYYFAFRSYLEEIKSAYKAIVAFSGEPEFEGEKVSEAKLNGFPSRDIEDRIQEDPYRFLICAEKFQTGYDEPLLHTMYVDKELSDIKAVQTLSRLNRAHPKKHDVFVLDFHDNAEAVEKAFSKYYRTTILSKETDPNKLHTLKSELDAYQVYSPDQVDSLVSLYLDGADRDSLDPILDACVAVYISELDENGQVDFKSKAKLFTRTYEFLATILPYGVPTWEKLSIFLNFLISKLPAPVEEDLSKGILEAIDMDSYRAEKKATLTIVMPDSDAEIDPIPMSGEGHKAEPELDRLSNILKAFNEQFAGLFDDAKRIEKRIAGEIPEKVAADPAYQNAKKNADMQNARIEHDKALQRVITALFKDDAQLFKQFQDNDSFRRWLTDTIFGMTYNE